jgi:peptide deformylase
MMTLKELRHKFDKLTNKQKSLFNLFLGFCMIREIVKFGHPVLRAKAKEIDTLTNRITTLIADLSETVDADSNGVGVCAPQVNESLRIFVIHQERAHEVMQSILKYEQEDYEPKAFSEKKNIGVYIHPKILSFSEEEWTYPEGCLSTPTLYGDVTRPWEIEVEALDEDFKPFKKTLVGYEARVFLHENDHLNGVLFIDRLDKKERKKMTNAMQELKKKFKEYNKQFASFKTSDFIFDNGWYNES